MFSAEDLERIKEIIHQFNMGQSKNNNGNGTKNPGRGQNHAKELPTLNPPEILALTGILCGTLKVSSLTLSREQVVLVSLEGSLRRPTQLEKVMGQIGQCSFEEVLRAMMKGLR